MSKIEDLKLEREELETQAEELQKEELITYLCDDNDFSKERISNTIKKLDKVEEQSSETLDTWFN